MIPELFRLFANFTLSITLATQPAWAVPLATSTTYDPLSQVTGVDYPANFAFADTTFTLDPVGNRTQVAAGSTTSYTANALNQYRGRERFSDLRRHREPDFRWSEQLQLRCGESLYLGG